MPVVGPQRRPEGDAETRTGLPWLVNRVFDRPPTPGSELEYWLSRGVGLLGGATPVGGATQALQMAQPQVEPPSRGSGFVDKALSVGGLLLPLLMGKGRARETFGDPLMDTMRRMYHGRALARTPVRESLAVEGVEPGSLADLRSMVRGREGAAQATPEETVGALRQQLEQPSREQQAFVPRDVPYETRTGERGVFEGVGVPEELRGGPWFYDVIADPGTNSVAVVQRKEGQYPMAIGDASRSGSGNRPISRHGTLGEALDASRYYAQRQNQAFERFQAGEGPVAPMGARQSGKYAPLDLEPSSRFWPLQLMYPWLTEPREGPWRLPNQ